MEKIRLGRTNMMVSRLGFGSVPIQRLAEDEAVLVCKRYLELVITFFDTANSYSTSEERIGKAIAGRREMVQIATKSYSRTGSAIEQHLEQSLHRLWVETIDLYQFHDVSDFENYGQIVNPAGPRAVLDRAKRAGRIKHIGISSHQIDVAREATKSDLFETIMFPLNFINGDDVKDLLALARDHDTGFIAMKPFEGGAITNVKIAFRYLLQFPDVVPIPGIATVGEIEEIVSLLDGPSDITEDEGQEMQRLREELGTQFCRHRNSCQPCPADIPISLILSNCGSDRHPSPIFFFGELAEAVGRVANCADCGECEGRCPYNLSIREMLAEPVAWYEIEKDLLTS